MKNNFYVYHLVDPNSNLPFYIGKGKNNRMYDHVRDTINQKMFNRNRYLFYKIKKLLKNTGYINYKKISENCSESNALLMEISEIKKYGRKNNKTGILCNMTDGGEGTTGYVPTSKMKRHLSKKRIKFLDDNPNIRRDLCERMKKYHLQGSKIAVGIISKLYTFVTPENNIITIKNLSEFCRTNNLNRDKMQKVVGGIRNKHKDYKNINYFNGGMKRRSNSKKMREVYNLSNHRKQYRFISPSDKIIDIFNLTNFCKKII